LTAAGAAEAGYLPVIVAGRAEPLWVALSDLVPPPAEPPTPSEVLEIAQRLVGVPYVWGGVSPYGIDCSGLVHLAHRRLGIVVPRDAADQADASRPVDAHEARPGDLYFFARPGSPIHHVGFVAGDRLTFHSSESAGRVQCDTVSGDLADTLVATHRTVG
jgi:cell wall-associated NlpC family hydrolase